MNYAEIKYCDIANGPGVRISLFVSGCTNHCENCFQPQTWDFHYGKEFTPEVEERIIGMMRPSYVCGLTVLGGEPFEPSNQKVLLPFLRRVRELYPSKSIWMFSGFTYDELKTDGSYPRCDETDEILVLSDVLVDGRYVERLRNISLRFRGSENQRLIDLRKTEACGHVVEWE